MVGFLLRLMSNPKVYQFVLTIDYYFPIRGHFYLPSNRIFGQIERVLHKTAVIKTPAQYHEVYEHFGTVHIYDDDWRM